jgi:thiopeptide-type bacteriocin biosynthesis protein
MPWAALCEAVHEWRTRRSLQRFWFVRKMPGLRLRFQVMQGDAGLMGPLTSWLQAAERRNDLRGFRFATYEPEVFRFGGPAGMEVAFTHFDAGSHFALRYETLPEEHRAELGRHTFSLVNTSDLLRRTLDDCAEIWDVWKRLEAAVGGMLAGPARGDHLRPLLGGYDGLAVSERVELMELLVRARSANEETAAALRALADGGVLSVGVRAWLAAATVFEWNRLGLPNEPEVLGRVISLAVEALAPDGAVVAAPKEPR